MRKRISLTIFGFCVALAMFGLFLVAPTKAISQKNAGELVVTTFADKTAEQCRGGSFLIFPLWYKYLTFKDDCTIKMDTGSGPVGKFDHTAIWLIGFAVIEILLTIAGMVAVAFVMIGGFKFVTAQGAPDTIASARKTLANAIVGAVMAIIAGRTVSFIANKLSSSAGTNDWGLVTADTTGSFVTISNYALTILGALSVITIIVSGIQFMVSSANPDKVKKARSAIYFALTGLAVAILASTIINFVIKKAV